MLKYLFGALMLAAVAIAASAAPAFTADSGAVVMNITVAAPPAPCLTVSPQAIDPTPTFLTNASRTGHAVWAPGESDRWRFRLWMPCKGSNGAGETKTFSVTFTAIVA